MEPHLDVVEVLGLGDGGGEPAVAEVASHLSVCTYQYHLAWLSVRFLQFTSVAKFYT